MFNTICTLHQFKRIIMVLEEPATDDDDELIPSFGAEESIGQATQTARPDEIVDVIVDYQQNVVPNMIEVGWMEEIAKSRAYHHNDMDQTMNAHILPGVEVLANIIEHAPGASCDDFRHLVALWTIHDVHKLVTVDGSEFDFGTEVVQEWVEKLCLDEFAPELTIKDYHSCAVSLHNSEASNSDDETTKFTSLRQYLRVTDAIMSINNPAQFVEEVENDIHKAFSLPHEFYVPESHTVNFDDAVIRTLANKALRDEFTNSGFKPIAARDDGFLYVRTESHYQPPMDEMIESAVGRFMTNIRESYQVFRNPAFLGGDIDSPQARSGYEWMPRVYSISNLAKLCLSRTEIIQRIVQASVEQQNRLFDLSNESQSQIEDVESETGVAIPQSALIEGFAALVHTVVREIIVELIDTESNKSYERTIEAAAIHVFGVSEEMQSTIAEALRSGNLNSSPVRFPFKYLIAKDLYDRYNQTVTLSQQDREGVISTLLLERLSDFDAWDDGVLGGDGDVQDELYLRFLHNVEFSGTELYNHEETHSEFNRLMKENQTKSTGKCCNCGLPTREPASSPSLLSHRDFDVLDLTFATEMDNGEFGTIQLDDAVPKNPLCVQCQVALTTRAQQFQSYDDDTELHVTVHPVGTVSVASILQFRKVLHQLKLHIFSGEKSGLEIETLAEMYEEDISDVVTQPSGIEGLVDPDQAFDVGARMDETSSRLSLPNNSDSAIVKGAACAMTAAMISGVRVCITRHPQLHMNHPESDSLVMLGPDMENLDSLLDNQTDVTRLPDRLRILDRLLQMSDKTGSPSRTLERFAALSDRNILPGSRTYIKVEDTFDSTEERVAAARDAVNIDAIAARNDVRANDLIASTSTLGDFLGKILPESNPILAKGIMMIACDTVETLEDINNTEQIVYAVTEDLEKREELDLSLQDLRSGGDAYKFAKQLADIFETQANGNQSTFSSVRRPLVDGTITRAMLYTMN